MGANSLLMWVNNSSIRINKLFSWTNSSLIQQRISLSRLALRLTPQGVCSPILKHHVKKKKKCESNQLLSLNDNTLQMSAPELPLLRLCLGTARAVSSPTAVSQINPGLLPQCVFWCSWGVQSWLAPHSSTSCLLTPSWETSVPCRECPRQLDEAKDQV